MGLRRDAESLAWCFNSVDVSIFPVDNYQRLENDPLQAGAGRNYAAPSLNMAPEGTPLLEWLSLVDTVLVPETLLPRTFELTKARGIRVVLIPNLDWAVIPGCEFVSEWVKALRSSPVELWAKTPRIQDTLAGLGLKSELVQWSIPDPVVDRFPVQNDGPMTFYMNCGLGGWRNRRGVDIALKAFCLLRERTPDARLILSTMKPLSAYKPPLKLPCDGIVVQTGFLSRSAIRANYASCSALLYPSRWEGFGLSLLEGLHAGCPVNATDGWPINELATHNENALLAPAERRGNVRLAVHWECSAADFAEAMWTMCTNVQLRWKLTGASAPKLRNRQTEFVRRVRSLTGSTS
jgi:glycosyltransferase involved in cell wall biosynthesis